MLGAQATTDLAPEPQFDFGALDQFLEIWCADFEFVPTDGERPRPICMIAIEARTGRTIRLWEEELRSLSCAPFRTDERALFVAHFASAEIGCFEALGWAHPENILDTFAESRVDTNGRKGISSGLLAVLARYGLPTIGAEEKESMRALIMSGGPWSNVERLTILDYCEGDTRALVRLLPHLRLRPEEDHPVRLGQALLRGRYMAAVARMEHNGVPIDVETLVLLKVNWNAIKERLIAEVDADYGVYEGVSFREALFRAYLKRVGICWPMLEDGSLKLDRDTFRFMGRIHPRKIEPLRQIRETLSRMRQISVAVGSDCRNRTILSPFGSKTGRNQPSSSKFIFGLPVWMRGLVRPLPGQGLAYLDFASQEIAIAAALSGDEALWEAYNSGDPYLDFAIRAGLAPPNATKKTHGDIRERCKAVVLGVHYGQAAMGMGRRAGITTPEADALLKHHKLQFRRFWEWSDSVVNCGLGGATLTTPFGWRWRMGSDDVTDRSLMNWPMQSAGADMLRLACIRGTRLGVKICAPVHDAVLIEAPLDELDEAIETMRSAMIWASEKVLGGGRTCRVDADDYRYPDRFMDSKRGVYMWNKIMDILGKPRWPEF